MSDSASIAGKIAVQVDAKRDARSFWWGVEKPRLVSSQSQFYQGKASIPGADGRELFTPQLFGDLHLRPPPNTFGMSIRIASLDSDEARSAKGEFVRKMRSLSIVLY